MARGTGSMINSLPNVLTMSRIAVIPVLVALFFIGEAEGDRKSVV